MTRRIGERKWPRVPPHHIIALLLGHDLYSGTSNEVFAEQIGDDREDDRVSGLDQLDFRGVLTTIATRGQTGVREI